MSDKDEKAESSPADVKAESSTADVNSESSSERESTTQVENAAGESTSPPEKAAEKAKQPSGREKWLKKLTEGRPDPEAKAEGEETEESETEAEPTSETEVEGTEETPEAAAEPEVETEVESTSTLSDEEFIKRLKPETARRFNKRNERITALETENTNLKPLAAIGHRISKVLADNQVPNEHFEDWTNLGIRVHAGDPEVPIMLFNMARGLAKDLGVELPRELPATEHPAYKKLNERLRAQIQTGAISHEVAQEALDELASTLGPVQSQPSVAAARVPATPQTRQAPPAQSSRVSIFSDPPMPTETKAVLAELMQKDKAMEQLHKTAWKPIQAAVAKKLETMQATATQKGQPIPPRMIPILFDQIVEAEVARIKAATPVKPKPKVPPTLKSGSQSTAGNNGTEKAGKAKAFSILTKT